MNAIPWDMVVLVGTALVAFFFTFVWIGVQIHGAVRFLGLEDRTTSTRAALAWGLSFVGGFMGPCVILASLVAWFLARGERQRAKWGEAGPGTLVASTTASRASLVILVMGAILFALVLLAQALAPSA